jgi:hypothetical protein
MLSFDIVVWVFTVILSAHESPPPLQSADFAKDVRPILEKRCQPCHFPGGTMHAKLPFDQPATIDKLGTKLFSRIKKDDEEAAIRAFLARAKSSD